MIGIVYLGTNSQTEERLKYIPGRLVRLTKNYKETAASCAPHVRNEHFIVFFEKKAQWNKMIERGMSKNYSWSVQKEKYENIYNYLIG